ncbi:type II toxin-antitoxin system VapC family toxin [Pseudactinotalea sp. Z1732]|uniref:type II toxin-antitoxin system VapC family toxin n=1 Tax=Micrococcales TaxID=85006 RepID=UPI003C7A21B8
MNGVLLDTNPLLWVLAGDPQLGTGARAHLTTSTSPRFSSASVLEITIKQMLGRLEVPGEVAGAAAAAGLVELPFRSHHASGLEEFPDLARHDPFDRMLLSQARHEDLLLLTSDRQLLELGIDRVIDARR